MIKANARDDKGPLAIFGLSGEDMTRLMAGEPIVFDLAELGFSPLLITILGGRTEHDIAADLDKLYGPIPFTCPRCRQTSSHPSDKRYGYCGACHDYTSPGAQT